MKRHHRQMLIVAALLTNNVWAADDHGPSSPPGDRDSSGKVDGFVELPDMVVTSGRLGDYHLIDKEDISGGGLAPGEPPIQVMYPGKAYAEGIPVGVAKVCIGLDENGEVTDYLLAGYSERYFGEALLAAVKATKFRPYRFKGVAIPSRYEYSYRFVADVSVPLSGFDAIQRRELLIRGGRPEIKYLAVTEAALDRRLERVREAVPHFPKDYVPQGGTADSVMVSLYVDEEGRVRVPRVESAASPALVRNALLAVRYWRFKPPTVKGQPALVFVLYAVPFIPAPGP